MVVAPEEYEHLGHKLTRAISRINGYRGVFQNITKYTEDSSPVIFLGSPAENTYTQKYLKEAHNLISRSGACYAYQGSKAMIFGDGNLESAVELKKVFRKYGLNLIKTKKLIPSLITKNLKNQKIKKLFAHTFPPVLSLLQTDAAASFFLEEAFTEWIGF